MCGPLKKNEEIAKMLEYGHYMDGNVNIKESEITFSFIMSWSSMQSCVLPIASILACPHFTLARG